MCVLYKLIKNKQNLKIIKQRNIYKEDMIQQGKIKKKKKNMFKVHKLNRVDNNRVKQNKKSFKIKENKNQRWYNKNIIFCAIYIRHMLYSCI